MQNLQKELPQTLTKASNFSPFPVVNGVRTAASQKLIDSRSFTKTKSDLSDIPEALL